MAPTALVIARIGLKIADRKIAITIIARLMIKTHAGCSTIPDGSALRWVRTILESLSRSKYWLSAAAPAADNPPVITKRAKFAPPGQPPASSIEPQIAAIKRSITIRNLNNPTNALILPRPSTGFCLETVLSSLIDEAEFVSFIKMPQ